MVLEQPPGVLPGLSRVDHDGLPRVTRQMHLLHKHGPLPVPRRIVVVIVQADLAERHHLGMRQQTLHLPPNTVTGLRSVVRVYPHGRQNGVVALGQPVGALCVTAGKPALRRVG